MTDKQTRWVLQSKESKKLYVKFFSKKIQELPVTLNFEIVGSYKPCNLAVTGVCEFPTINTNPKQVYMVQKRLRPPTEPESFLKKTYIMNESQFDFGPLLIKKNPETRSEDKVKEANGTFFTIANNGKYKLNASFTLRSTLPPEEGGP